MLVAIPTKPRLSLTKLFPLTQKYSRERDRFTKIQFKILYEKKVKFLECNLCVIKKNKSSTIPLQWKQNIWIYWAKLMCSTLCQGINEQCIQIKMRENVRMNNLYTLSTKYPYLGNSLEFISITSQFRKCLIFVKRNYWMTHLVWKPVEF